MSTDEKVKNIKSAFNKAFAQNAPAKITETALAPMGAWGAAEGLDASDMKIGKIYHQQALSDFVSAGDAQAGDWCDSLTGDVLAKKDEPLELIIFLSKKKIMVSKAPLNSNKFELVETLDVTPDNCNFVWEETISDGTIRRQLCYDYFCLVPSLIDVSPFVLSLYSTKIKTAKKLNTMIGRLSRQGLPSAAYVWNFTSVKETGDKGNWFGAEVAQGRATTEYELEKAKSWFLQLKKVTTEEKTFDTSTMVQEDLHP